MAAPAPDPSALEASLRSLRRTALLSVGVIALGVAAIALRSDVDQRLGVDRPVTFGALALASVSVLARRSFGGAVSARAFVARHVASVLAAVGLALLGGFVALRDGQWQIGLLYEIAAALLLFRPAERFSVIPRRER
ncbi:MAG TPA: hypothetical protein VMW19_00195 [Myxococcota bacterium]|nr:hypothetical protein [Myxococcota bacterium]